MTAIFTSSYQHLAELTQSTSLERMAIIDQSDLRSDEVDVLNQASVRLSFESNPAVRGTNNHKGSPHQHSASDYGLENKEIEVCLMPAYRVILQSKQRITPRIPRPNQEHGARP